MTKKLADIDGSFAQRCGYSEINLYILSQSLIPLIEIVKPFRRKILEEIRSGYDDELKIFAFSILRILKKYYDEKTAKPDAVAEYLVMVFDNLRELTKEEADEVLDFFELSTPEKSAGLFIYFAHYRNKNFPKSPIDEKYFKERLERLCSTRGELRQRIAWQIWRGVDSKSMPENEKDELLIYVPHFLSDYDPEVFSLVSHIFESGLKNKGRYQATLVNLKNAMGLEIKELQKTKGPPRISLRESAKTILENSVKDFLDLLEIVLNVSDPKTGKGVYGTNLYPMIGQFKLIIEVPVSLNSQHSDAKKKLEEIGAFL